MCDYSLQYVKSRPAKVGDKLTTHRLQYRHDEGSLRWKRPTRRFALFRERSLPLRPRLSQATRVVWLEGESGQSHDGDLSANQQAQPANTS